MCLPPRVVNEALRERKPVTEIWYTPEPAHDYCAFVLLVFALLFPSQYLPLRVSNLRDETKREKYLKALQEMHTHPEGCPTFGKWWEYASGGRLTDLRGLCNLLPWPEEDTYC